MRIATSTIYSEQTQSIDNLQAIYQQQGQELSTGKSLNVPSDDPTVIAQDLAVRNDSAVSTQIGNNLTNLNNELTTVDGSLSSLTNILQGARQLAVSAASGTVTPAQQKVISTQVDQLLQEAVGLANTQYGGAYVFTGTATATSLPPVQTNGTPISGVTAQTNDVVQQQDLPNGQKIASNLTLKQTFNFNAPDGSPDVFQTLIALRDTLATGQVVDASAQQVNVPGNAINPAVTTVANLVAGASPQIMATPLQPDASGNVSINIASAANTSGVNVTFLPTDTVANVIAKINAAAGPLGITASFDPKLQRISFNGGTGAFQINDVPSAGSATSSNFTKAFGLTNQADVVNDVSTQLGTIDHVLQVALNARATLGATLQSAAALQGTESAQVLNDTKVQSGLEDADIAKVVAQFSATQTALQAAYGTTSRLEQKSLFDYLQ
ncbi:MAG: flagellar hook-associated protein FlgL [Candidatus Eremiobacteraeota bacterium]|nr:flagellar hook-associated protein FlgL [Candidatus Eremiobacteraeota bacterium]